ncbi:MAG TPA: hypothetical protein VKA55_11485 [Gammaproteobacteria bacterium]|nr:hypothetical protein [Gammaproteobacteria bacterium]
MRDTTNMPTADWSDPKTLNRAKAQLMRDEPLVVNLPADADLTIDEGAAGCQRDDSGLLWNCDPGVTLRQLGGHPGLEGMEKLAKAATGHSRVDVDGQGHRLVFHD